MRQMKNTSQTDAAARRQARYLNEAMSQLEAKQDRNAGGILLGRRMVHRSGRDYNRQALKRQDRRGDY